MFGWRKKNDGFVWNEYVRTTVLMRRENRRQKIEDVKVAAVDGIKHAGRQGVAAGAAGVKAAGRGTWSAIQTTAQTVFDWTGAALTATGFWIADRSKSTWGLSSPSLARLGDTLRLGTVAGPLLLVAIIAAISAAARWSEVGFDLQASIASGVAFTALALIVLPRALNVADLTGFANSLGQRVPTNMRLTPELFSALSVGAGLVALVGTLSWITASITTPPQGTNAAVAVKPTLVPMSGRIEGRAVVLSGDRIKVGPTVVRLSGIEAPDANQVCPGSSSRTWGCGLAAKSALQKIVGTKQVACDVQTRSSDATAACQVAGADIAGQLVRGGHVFAESGLFPTYGRAESEARAAKVGIWQGEAERPAAYRAKVWDEAKRAAPGGCPIKGVLNGDARSFVMPGASNYDKTKVRTAKGERWFCSEEEALAAGWKSAAAS
jgi:endonuclease YncB( thermonuclease family)